MDNDDLQFLIAVVAVIAFAVCALLFIRSDNRKSKIIIDRNEYDEWQR